MVEELRHHYIVGEEIGRGCFGVVRRCTALSTGEIFAVKSISKSQLLDDIDRKGVELEATLACLASVDNPGAVPVHAVYNDFESIHLVMEFCDGPDLLDWMHVRPEPQVSEPEAAVIMAQLMQTLEICHKRGIAHRDVKPENILFDRNSRVRLSDFGSAAWFGTQNGMEQRMSGIVGTPCYMAPEILRGGEYDEKVDIWSAGVVMYVMLSGGVVPFGNGDDTPADVFGAVLLGNLRFPSTMFKGISAEAKDLMRKMICRDPFRRFTAEQVLRHPWIQTGGVVMDTD